VLELKGLRVAPEGGLRLLLVGRLVNAILVRATVVLVPSNPNSSSAGRVTGLLPQPLSHDLALDYLDDLVGRARAAVVLAELRCSMTEAARGGAQG